MSLSNKAILAIQTAGFVGALAALVVWHGLCEAVFAVCFGVHFAGDLLRLKKDGVI